MRWNRISNDKFVIEDTILKEVNKRLRKVEIPEGVTSIADGVFENCKSLQSIVIPNSVTSIGEKAFNGCTSLKSVVIPDSVTSINKNAFDGCTSLKTINFLGTRNQWKELKLKLDGNIIVKCSDD